MTEYEASIVDKARRLEKLLSDADFAELIMQDYYLNGLIQFGEQTAYATSESQALVLEQIKARALFKQYIDTLLNTAKGIIENARNHSDDE